MMNLKLLFFLEIIKIHFIKLISVKYSFIFCILCLCDINIERIDFFMPPIL